MAAPIYRIHTQYQAHTLFQSMQRLQLFFNVSILLHTSVQVSTLSYNPNYPLVLIQIYTMFLKDYSNLFYHY